MFFFWFNYTYIICLDPSKSNDGHSLKLVSNENIASKSPSLEAPDSRQVSNGQSADDPVSASHTSSSSVFPFKSTKEDTKKVVIDDPKAISTGIPAESPPSLSFGKSSLSKKNTSDSKAPDNSVSSSDQISQNGIDVPKQILQNQAAANIALRDFPASDEAPVSTLSTDNPAPGNGTTSKPISKNNTFDKDTTPSG